MCQGNIYKKIRLERKKVHHKYFEVEKNSGDLGGNLDIQVPDDGRLISLESRLHKWFGCQVTAVSKVDCKSMSAKGMISRKKKCQ